MKKSIKKNTLIFLNLIIKPFYGTGIGKYPFFKQMFYFYNYLYKKLKIDGEILIKTKYNIQMFVNTNGDYVEKELILKGVWEEYISELILKNIRKGDTFLDLGANIGYYSLITSEKIGKTGKIFSYEPSQQNYNQFKKNIKINNIKNIEALKYGVGNKNEKIEIFFNKNNPGGTSVIKRNENKNFSTEKIEIVVLDDIFKKTKINFIKMDIEGYEYNAILGMKNILKNNKNIKLLFEFSPILYKELVNNYKEYSINILKTLNKYGFNLYHIDEINKKINLISNYEKYFDNIKTKNNHQSNILCTKS